MFKTEHYYLFKIILPILKKVLLLFYYTKCKKKLFYFWNLLLEHKYFFLYLYLYKKILKNLNALSIFWMFKTSERKTLK